MPAPDLVVFGEDWGGLPSSTQHLIRGLVQDRRIVWVNSIGLRRPRLGSKDIGRLARKGLKFLSSRTRTEAPVPHLPGLKILQPLALPIPASPLARKINHATLGWQIRRALASSGMARPVFWTSLPTAVAALGAFETTAVVYYCGDDFSALAGVDHAPVTQLEAELADQADLIIAASEALADRFPSEKTMLLPHGVDFDHFSRPVPRAEDLPARGPIAGFYGSISEWVNLELIAELARRNPDWSFVMIGPVRCDVSILSGLANLQLLGPRPHSELPRYVQHWSVSMMLFRRNPQIEACNPLKLREYLAAGTPVLATEMPALNDYRDLIQVIDAQSDLRAALQSTAADFVRNHLRRQSVASEDWEARVVQVADALSLLAERNRSLT